MIKFDDPMEDLIGQSLIAIGEPFYHEIETGDRRIDFYLPNRDLYIEVKQFHAARIVHQMEVAPNVIVAQGRIAVEALAQMIRTWK